MEPASKANANPRRPASTNLGQALQRVGNPLATPTARGSRAVAGNDSQPPGGIGVRLISDSTAHAAKLEAMLQQQRDLCVLETRVVEGAGLELCDGTGAWRGAQPGLLLVDSALSSRDLVRLARRHRAVRGGAWMVLMSPERDAQALDAILEAGAHGVIPRDFDAPALAAALKVVACGQRFRPYVRPARVARVRRAETSAPQQSRSALDVQADKPLSAAELDVCRLVAQHLTDREIAELRGTGRGTVRSQVNSLMRKLGCKRRDEAGEIYRRLYEIDDNAVQLALRGENVNLDWLLEFMEVELGRKGDVLFRRGQTARKLYYLESGQIRLPEIGTVMHPGVLFGEIGIFTPDHKRMHTAECATDVRLRTLDAARVWRYYQLKPQFAVQMLCLITRRLLADINRLRA